jgi:DNA-directed RNA polymerase subunit K/omega
MSQKKQVVIRKKTESKVKDTVISEELLDSKKQSKVKFNVIESSEDNKTHETVQKTKKIIKKANDTKSSLNIFDVDNVDYRYIMTHYDFSKNKSRAVITQYEKALMIGKRATQIERGCHPNVKVLQGQTPIHIAEEELRQRKIPFIIERTIGSSHEYWKPIDMEIDLD